MADNGDTLWNVDRQNRRLSPCPILHYGRAVLPDLESRSANLLESVQSP